MATSTPTEQPSSNTSAEAPSDSLGATLVERLRRSFDAGRTRPLAWRLEQVRGLERFMSEREDEILEALARDLGKPNLEGFIAEVAYMNGEIALTKKSLEGWMKPDKVSSPIFVQPAKSVIVKEPLGCVLVIAPWNYPFQLALAPLLGALAAGNCAVVKPSEVAPYTSALIAKYLTQYVDPSCVAVVEGGIPETTDLLDQRWDHIFYTGNGHVGRIVMTAAAKHLTPVTLELGGKSPCIVNHDTDVSVAAKRIAWGKWYNCGQTCVAPDYLLVHRSVHDRFVDVLRDTVREFWGADPQQSSDYGRIINERHHDRLMKLMDSGTIAVGGGADRADRYIAPTVLTDVSPDSPVMADEIFGPILPVLAVDSVDEAVRFINARPKPLALYCFTENDRVQQDVIRRTSSGGMSINHVWMHLAVHGLPFGGVGESGMGAYHGKTSFDCFTHQKSVLMKGTKLDPPLAYPPYTELKKKLLRRLV